MTSPGASRTFSFGSPVRLPGSTQNARDRRFANSLLQGATDQPLRAIVTENAGVEIVAGSDSTVFSMFTGLQTDDTTKLWDFMASAGCTSGVVFHVYDGSERDMLIVNNIGARFIRYGLTGVADSALDEKSEGVDYHIDTSGGAVSLSLDAADFNDTPLPGATIRIFIQTGGNTITITPTTYTINGSSSAYVIRDTYHGVELSFDGTSDWYAYPLSTTVGDISLLDDTSIYFGDDDDANIQWTTTGTHRLLVTSATTDFSGTVEVQGLTSLTGGAFTPDDVTVAFGNTSASPDTTFQWTTTGTDRFLITSSGQVDIVSEDFWLISSDTNQWWWFDSSAGNVLVSSGRGGSQSGGILTLNNNMTESIISGRELGQIYFTGDDPVQGSIGFRFKVEATGAWSTDNFPTMLTAWTGQTGSGQGLQIMQMDENGIHIGSKPLNLTPTSETVSAVGGITPASSVMSITGDGGAIDITANPQIAAGTADGQLLILRGTSDSNTVQIDNENGVHVHGRAILRDHDQLTLMYHSGDSAWEEVSRNFTSSEKAWSFISPSGSSGTFYVGGFYIWAAAVSTFGGGQTLGTANSSYAAHVVVISSGGPGDGDVTVTVSGTSIDDEGNRDATPDTEVLTIASAEASGTFHETSKKWIGQVTLTAGGAGTPVNCDYGFAKYWDNANQDFIVEGFEMTGRAGANDANPNIELLHHKNTGWTYAAGGTPTTPTSLADMNVDHNTEIQFVNGDYFAYKRVDLLTKVTGSGSEGTIVRITTAANKAVEQGNIILRIRTA